MNQYFKAANKILKVDLAKHGVFEMPFQHSFCGCRPMPQQFGPVSLK